MANLLPSSMVARPKTPLAILHGEADRPLDRPKNDHTALVGVVHALRIFDLKPSCCEKALNFIHAVALDLVFHFDVAIVGILECVLLRRHLALIGEPLLDSAK